MLSDLANTGNLLTPSNLQTLSVDLRSNLPARSNLTREKTHPQMLQFTLYSKTKRSNQERASLVEPETLTNRFRTDEKRRRQVEWLRVGRSQLPLSSFSKECDSLPLVCPGKAVRRHRNGTEETTYNGVVLLEVDNLPSHAEVEAIKERVKAWPTTLAALTGFSGLSVKVLVKGTFEDGTLPTDRELIDRFHHFLYSTCAQVYATLIGRPLKTKDASKDDRFRWTSDNTLFLNPLASPVRISRRDFMNKQRVDDVHEYDPSGERPSQDTYSFYRRRFSLAVQQARELLGKHAPPSADESSTINETADADMPALLNATAREALRLGIPQEESVQQAQSNPLFNTLGKDYVRAAIESTYAENHPLHGTQRTHQMQNIANALQNFFRVRYDLRYNVLSNSVEWRRRDSASFTFLPLDTRVMNSMLQECYEAGLEATDRDMKRYLGSSRVRDFNAAHAYLNSIAGRWDGQTDYIGQMADRIPTDNPGWKQQFHTWFLGMVAQWDGWQTAHVNSLLPLIIGTQGCGKRSFGELLLPPELRDIGYREVVDFSSKQEAERLLSTSLLINLDEISQISKKIQQGFLKSLVLQKVIKGRRPFGSVTLALPRFASFIATAHLQDVLNAPPLSRYYIIANIRDGQHINLNPPFHYDAMYAQALAELNAGHRHFFTAEEAAAIEEHNTAFTQMKPEVRHFLDVFIPATERSKQTVSLRLSELAVEIQRQTGIAYSDRSLNCLGRWLTAEAKGGRIRKTMHNGSPVYVVKRRHSLGEIG